MKRLGFFNYWREDGQEAQIGIFEGQEYTVPFLPGGAGTLTVQENVKVNGAVEEVSEWREGEKILVTKDE